MISHFGILVLSGISAALNYQPSGYGMCRYRCSQISGCRTFWFCPLELVCSIAEDKDHMAPECSEKQTFILDRNEQHGSLSDVSSNLSCPTFSRIIRNRRNSAQCVKQSVPAARALPPVNGFLVAQKDASYGTFRIVDLEGSKEIPTNIQAAHVTSFVYASSIQRVIMSLEKQVTIMSYPLNGVGGEVMKRNLTASNMAVDDNRGFLFLTLNGDRTGAVRISLNNRKEIYMGAFAVYHGLALDTIKAEIYLRRRLNVVRKSYDGHITFATPVKRHADTLALDGTNQLLFYSRGKTVFQKTFVYKSPERILTKVGQEIKNLIYKDGVLYMTYRNSSNDIGAFDTGSRKYSVIRRLNYKVAGVLNICLFP